MTREIDLDLGGTDHGYIYSITFDGAGVQGNVPQLTVTDFGTDGCMSFNGTMYHNESTSQRAFIPLYKVQTTADLAKNASADDVEAALEAYFFGVSKAWLNPK